MDIRKFFNIKSSPKSSKIDRGLIDPGERKNEKSLLKDEDSTDEDFNDFQRVKSKEEKRREKRRFTKVKRLLSDSEDEQPVPKKITKPYQTNDDAKKSAFISNQCKLLPTSAADFFGDHVSAKKQKNDELHRDDNFTSMLRNMDNNSDKCDDFINECQNGESSVTVSQKLSQMIGRKSIETEKKHISSSYTIPRKPVLDQQIMKTEPCSNDKNSKSLMKTSPRRNSIKKDKTLKKTELCLNDENLKSLLKTPPARKLTKKDKNSKKTEPCLSDENFTSLVKTPPARNSVKKDKTPTISRKSFSKHSKDEDSEEIIQNTPHDEQKLSRQVAYKKFLTRGGARNPGCKDIPNVSANSLSGLVFVLTGVFESLEREQMMELIKSGGGKVTTSVSRNTNYIVVGEEAGESKIKKAELLGTKKLDEDKLLDLIRSKNSDSMPLSEILPKKSDKKTTNHIKPSVKKDELKSTKPPVKLSDSVKSVTHKPIATELWVDKYKPTISTKIIGQQGEKSCVNKLKRWLLEWHANHSSGGDDKRQATRPPPWGVASDTGSWTKCALLSGPPGIGKTTTAHLVSRECGFDIMELNASDSRSKHQLDAVMADALSTSSLSSTSNRRVMIMDEVDGMAGNEDRGGIAELIQLLKTSKIPIICMCNDRNSQKIRSLANHCFDLRFLRPRVEQITAAMMSVCFKEDIKISKESLVQLIVGCNHDVRQVLHHLTMLQIGTDDNNCQGSLTEAKTNKTSIKMGPWDVCKKVFTANDHINMTLFDKSDLFFHDYSFGPLFVQENYLSVTPAQARGDKKRTLELISQTADSICLGDLVGDVVRSKNAWSLLPIQAIFASVLPGEFMSGFVHAQVQFPSWLGQNSKQKKFDRILQELQTHTRLSLGETKRALNEDYLQYISNAIVQPLVLDGVDGIGKSLNVMNGYSLLRDDLDNLLEITSWPGKSHSMKSVDSKVKSAFTRAYNKENILLPYATHLMKIDRKRSQNDADVGYSENEGENITDTEDNIEMDSMIKAKKQPDTKKSSTQSKSSKGPAKEGGLKESKKRNKKSSSKIGR